jgi:hypothetical protein
VWLGMQLGVRITPNTPPVSFITHRICQRTGLNNLRIFRLTPL